MYATKLIKSPTPNLERQSPTVLHFHGPSPSNGLDTNQFHYPYKNNVCLQRPLPTNGNENDNT